MARRLIDSIQYNDIMFLRSECLQLLGDIEYVKKNFEKALNYYAKSEKNNPPGIEIYIKLGHTHEKMRQFEEAISQLKKAVRRDQKSFEAHYRIGLCYIRNNQKDEGIRHLCTAHQLEPNDIETMLKLCEIYLKEDKMMKDAEQMSAKVIQLQDDLPEAYIIRGRILEKKN